MPRHDHIGIRFVRNALQGLITGLTRGGFDAGGRLAVHINLFDPQRQTPLFAHGFGVLGPGVGVHGEPVVHVHHRDFSDLRLMRLMVELRQNIHEGR